MCRKKRSKDPERYKTVPCATFQKKGSCPYGKKCQFAHGEKEVRIVFTEREAAHALGSLRRVILE